MKELGEKLINIHSQGQTVTLNDTNFQLAVIDSYSGITESVNEYRIEYQNYLKLSNKLTELIKNEKQSKTEQDYFKFLYQELDETKLNIDEQEIKKTLGFVIIVNSSLFCFIFITAPLVARFFSEPLLVTIVRVLGINFVLMSFYIISQSMLIRELKFRKKSLIEWSSNLFSSGIVLIMALLGFWGAVGRMFSLRQGKRLFGLIDSGQIFGAILSTFAIPVLISVGFAQKNLLFLSSVSVMCAFIMQIIISVKYNLNQETIKKEKKRKRLPELLKNKYVLYMSIFVIMSMLAAFFIQFTFLSVTKENYPDHNDLAEFLGAFTGSLLLFTFLFKTFLYSKLMKTYGLKVSVIISSFLLGIFTVIAVVIGSVFGYTTASASFMFFFLIISLSRLFSKALKDAVEVPAFKIMYQSLKAEIRHDVQAYVDGTINEIAALFAGLLLATLSLFEFFKLIHFSYSLILILVIWFFIARKLYVEYKISLQKSLAEYKGN